MSVSTKALDRYIRPLATNSAEDSVKRAARLVESNRVVASENKQINWVLVVDSIKEPLFLNHVSCLDNFRDVAVASEVEQDAKGHDVQTSLGGEVAVWRADVLKLASGRVPDLHVAGEVLVAIHFGEVAEGFVGDLGDVELMIANCQKIVLDILEDGIGNKTVRGCCIGQTSAIMEVLTQSATQVIAKQQL